MRKLFLLLLLAVPAWGQLPWTAGVETDLSEFDCGGDGCATTNASMVRSTARANSGAASLLVDAVTGAPNELLLDSIPSTDLLRTVFFAQQDDLTAASVDMLMWRDASNVNLFTFRSVSNESWTIRRGCGGALATIFTFTNPTDDAWHQIELTWEKATGELCAAIDGGALSCSDESAACLNQTIENFYLSDDTDVDFYFDDFLIEDPNAVAAVSPDPYIGPF